MTIQSPAFHPHETIPSKYTCEGENINPPLLFSHVPSSALSLVLIMDDPDAPLKTWVHWTVWNIDPAIASVSENNVPPHTVEGMTSFDSTGYGGPCPHAGTHRYFFKLYALDTMLDLPVNTEKKEIEKAMDGHILESAELIGLYKKTKII